MKTLLFGLTFVTMFTSMIVYFMGAGMVSVIAFWSQLAHTVASLF